MAHRLQFALRMTKAALVLALLVVPLTARPTDHLAIVASTQVDRARLESVAPRSDIGLSEALITVEEHAEFVERLMRGRMYLTIVRALRHGSAVIAGVLNRFLGLPIADDVASPPAKSL